jgi:hypothetical protein
MLLLLINWRQAAIGGCRVTSPPVRISKQKKRQNKAGIAYQPAADTSICHVAQAFHQAKELQKMQKIQYT